MPSTESETDAATSTNPTFVPEWTPADIAGLSPSHVPLRRIPRAWERKPHSPFARKTQSRKIWRRVQTPVLSGASLKGMQPDKHVECSEHGIRHRGGTIQSPKKAVKKSRLDTLFGQDSRVTNWEREKGRQMRRKALAIPVLLPTPQIKNSAPEGDIGVDVAAQDLESALNSLPEDDQDETWSDVTSDDEAVSDEEVELETALEAIPLTADQIELLDGKDSTSADEIPETDVVATESPQPAEMDVQAIHDDQDKEEADVQACDEAQEEAEAPRITVTGHFTEAENAVSQSLLEPTVTLESQAQPTLQASVEAACFEISPVKRSVSAPPEESCPLESRTRPRVSDDTAILHAFLNRAAAGKKNTSMAKRESLSNRRDSDVIRHALASPAKVDVLGELDPNSPSPRKDLQTLRQEDADVVSNNDTEAEADAGDSDTGSPAQNGRRPARRSARSRTRPTTLLSQIAPTLSASGPNKITIRASTDQVPLKRSEIQEIALVTRSNTRKNKGQAVLPVIRLSKLAAEAVMNGQSPKGAETSEQTQAKVKNKGVRWDKTLAYFSDAPNEVFSSEVDLAMPAPGAEESVDPVPPMSPTKARSKRTKSPRESKTENASVKMQLPEAETATAPQVVAAVSQPKPAPAKKRSRIATPAKGLLSTASLLPSDVAATVAAAAGATTATTTMTTGGHSAPTQQAKRTSTRTLPAPRKLNLSASSIGVQDGKENQSKLTTPKKSSIPSVKTAVPAAAAAAAVSATTTTTTITGSKIEGPRFTARADGAGVGAEGKGDKGAMVAGLASPAKKRKAGAGAGVGMNTSMGSGMVLFGKPSLGSMAAGGGKGQVHSLAGEDMPGLASPAKKRVRSHVL